MVQLGKEDQLGRVYLIAGLLFITLGLGSDGVPALLQSRTPPPAMMGLPNLPISLTGYSYVIVKLGPLTFTRKGLSVASTVACLTFTVLLTTPTTPINRMKAIVDASEGFVYLVHNIALGIVSRRVNWKARTDCYGDN